MSAFDPLRHNRASLFWTLHVVGWLGYALTQYVGALIYEKMAGYLLVISLAAVSGFLLTLELRYIYRRLWLKSPRVIIVGALSCCYLFALLQRVVINGAWMVVGPDSEMGSILEIFFATMSSMYLFLCWSALYFGVKYYESLQLQREATLRAGTLAQEAQLKMLRYQLNPHFLFNTLNAISTLILDNQNRTANQTVMRLSEFLRYTLDQDPMKR